MTKDELNELMSSHGLEGQPGAEGLAIMIGVSWRTIYRYKSGRTPINKRTETAILAALAGTRSISVATHAARKSNQK